MGNQLIETLRAVGSGVWPESIGTLASIDRLANEAADEIERLERELIDAKQLLREAAQPGVLHFDLGVRIDRFLGRADCVHEWIDMRNAVITSGEWCRKCNAVQGLNEGDLHGLLRAADNAGAPQMKVPACADGEHVSHGTGVCIRCGATL